MDDFNLNNNDENKKSIKYEKMKSKWLNFTKNLVNKEGFYLVLFICISIIATTSVWISKKNVEKYKELTELNNDMAIENVEDIFSENSTVTVLDDNDVKAKETPKEETSSISTSEESNDNEANLDSLTEEMLAEESVEASFEIDRDDLLSEMILPVRGTVSKEFAIDKLVYSETLEQWSTHNGIDIRSVAGSEVKSVLDGIITNIEKTEQFGITITIDHGAGIMSKYSCLSTSDMVELGEKVTKGEVISAIGNPVGFELSEGPHLHFELLIDGENVNPSLYIPVNN